MQLPPGLGGRALGEVVRWVTLELRFAWRSVVFLGEDVAKAGGVFEKGMGGRAFGALRRGAHI